MRPPTRHEMIASLYRHVEEMEASGKKSMTNYVEDVVGVSVADAAEVQKHALAAQTYAMILWPPGSPMVGYGPPQV